MRLIFMSYILHNFLFLHPGLFYIETERTETHGHLPSVSDSVPTIMV